jgi:hypothetical protein
MSGSLSSAKDVRDATHTPFALAENTSTRKGILDHCIAERTRGNTDERPRSFPSIRKQMALTKRSGMARDVWLTFVEQLRELTNAEFIIERQRQKPKTHGFREYAVKLPSGQA